MEVRVLDYKDTVELLPPQDCVKAIHNALIEQAKGTTVNRPRSHTYSKLKNGNENDWYAYILKTMDGIIQNKNYAALRIASVFWHHFSVDGNSRESYETKITTKSGDQRFLELVMLFDTRTGALVSIMPGAYIQSIRVGCSTAVGNSYIARKESGIFGLIGSGWQARAQLIAHKQLFGIDEVKVYSISQQHRERFADEVGSSLGINIKPVSSAEQAVKDAEVVLCATSSHNPATPVIRGEWLGGGSHWSIITREVGKDTFERSDRITVLSHTIASNVVAPADNMADYIAKEEQPVNVRNFPTLADVINGNAIGRGDDQEITGFVTTQGLGIQFVALASLAFERAVERGIGRVENWDHLLQQFSC